MSSVLSDKHFHDERAAYAFVEARLWPNGPTCPHDNSRQYWRTLSLSPSATLSHTVSMSSPGYFSDRAMRQA